MAKFFGEVGYNVGSVEKTPGVWANEIVERKHFGDIVQNYQKFDSETSVNTELQVANSISIITDAYAQEHFFAMRYVRWAGALWTVKAVEVKGPRLILRLGGVYNGPTAPAPSDPDGDSA